MTEHTYTHTHCSLCACVLPCFSGARLFADAMDCSPPGSSLHGDSLGKCWRGLPCPPLGDLYDPVMEPASPATLALQADSLLLSHPGRPHCFFLGCYSSYRLESDTTERLHFPFSLSCIGEGNGNPLQCSCLENPRDGGAWWAAISGVAQSQTRLK